MRYIKFNVNVLTNIALCICVIILSIYGAEYVLRRTAIEGLSGYKIWVGERGNSKDYPLLTQVVAAACKDFEFTEGNCYPSDSTGCLPLKVINPYDRKYWYCVSYNKKQRLEGYNPDRKRQIALVGDSFTFGEGVKESDTLGYLLNEKYPKINFQNWGISGGDITTAAGKCKEIIESLPTVNMVIYFYNLNDVRTSSLSILQMGELLFWQPNLYYIPQSAMVSSRAKNIIDFQNIQLLKDEQRCGTLVKMLSKSELFSLARKIWIIRRESSRTVQNYRDMYLSEYNRQEFLRTMDDIRSIKDMLAARGISFRMIIYPLLYKDMLGRYPFESIHAAIVNACRARGIICLDGYVPFKSYYSLKKFAVHPIDYHPNGLSNRELVDYIHNNNFITNGPE